MRVRRVEVDLSRCAGCGFCAYVNVCRSPRACCGCLSCFWACPYSARFVVEEEREAEPVEVLVDGVRAEVPSGITVGEPWSAWDTRSASLALGGRAWRAGRAGAGAAPWS